MKAGEELQNNDFKYVMMDMGNIYLGAKLSYEELLNEESSPFKLKAVIRQYILKETMSDTTLESQFYYLEKGMFLYEIFSQLKVKVKVNIQVEKKSLWGKSVYRYEERILKLKELAEMNLAKKKALGVIVYEVIVSKLGLMTFSL
ncbi:MAG: hypothetical protein HDR10_12250 [Lachnospiraceae bacterium]|nr:hypothetical protein [Lachnospiraceae bacterium]